MSTATGRSKPFPKLKNEGTFEGFVGKRPVLVENKKGTPQCFLDVGHTPLYFDGNGNFCKEKRPVWMHFVCFGKIAEFAVECIRVGQRVMVDYKITARFHPKYGTTASFQAKLLRPIARGFELPDEVLTGDTVLNWRPATAKGQEKWTKVEEPLPDEVPAEVVDDEEDDRRDEDQVA